MINQLRKGSKISNKRHLHDAAVKHWKYSAECGTLLGGLLPGATLEVVEICTLMGQMWVKAILPGRSPQAHLKISGEEYANNFHAHPVPAHQAAAQAAVSSIEHVVNIVQQEFPQAGIRITGRARTVQRQAELMADRRLKNRVQFLHTYKHASHITEMDQWAAAHPRASLAEAATAFADIINRARAHGATVSNHLSDSARDISIPHGGPQVQKAVLARLHQLRCHVIDEKDATGGPHWHVDFAT